MFYYLEGTQISHACARRWAEAGWIALCEHVGDEYHYVVTLNV